MAKALEADQPRPSGWSALMGLTRDYRGKMILLGLASFAGAMLEAGFLVLLTSTVLAMMLYPEKGFGVARHHLARRAHRLGAGCRSRHDRAGDRARDPRDRRPGRSRRGSGRPTGV